MIDTPKPGDPDDDAQGRVPPAADERPAVADAARRIAAGEPVDWPLVESDAEDSEAREVLDALHGVESIATFHRQWQAPEAGQANAGASPPFTWGGLTVVREIGRGSFGRVYLARDARLDRDVALKILDPAAAGDSPHGAAVIEEGRHLARLRHPNVVSVFGADLVDGRVGLEMELIEGRTLAEIVRDDGRLGADEAALIGRDVCRALAAVHGAGLVHRDVKAQNVIRERGGRIVLMDFGSGRRAAPDDKTDLAGTPLYLAPEVLAGSAPTPRSDLYSVGALLYFLTTGSFPVAARTLDGLRAAHRSGERTPLRDVRPDLPQPFVDLVERALAPSPDSRPESAGRFEAELAKVLGQVDRPNRPDVTARRWIATAIVAAVAAIVTLAWAFWQPPPASNRTERFAIPLDGSLTVGGGLGSSQFALSPDGTRLAWSTMAPGRGARISIRDMDDVTPRVIDNTGDAGRAFFSPDGEWIGFHQSAPTGGRLMKIAIAGGSPIFVADWPQQAGASWSADGSIVFSSRGDLWRVAESGGTPERLTTLDLARDGHAIRPHAMAGGHVVFTLRRRDGSATAVALLSRDRRVSTLVPDATSGKFVPPGLLVYAAGNPPWIMAAPFDPQRLELTGSPVQVQALRSPVHWFDVSASGTLVFSMPDEPAPGDAPELVWVDRDTGHEEPLTRSLPLVPGQYFAQSLRLSPDARKVAYTTSPNALIETVDTPVPGLLWIGDLVRGLAQLVTGEPVQPIAWSRDGTRITYRTREGAIAWRRVDGSGPEEQLAAPAPDLDCTKGEWSPDGRVLLVACGGTSGADPRRGFVTLTFPTAEAVGKAPVQPEVFLSATPGQGGPRFSPDGRWITYSANLSGEQGAHAVYARAFPGPGPTHRISPHGIPPTGGSAVWRGRELFYLTETGPRVVDIRQTHPGLVFDPPRAAVGSFSAYDTASTGGLTFDLSPDGRRFLVLRRGRGGDYVTRLSVALHWADEVKRKIQEAGRAR